MPTLLTADLRIRGDKAEAPGRVLFDTGASYSFVRRDLAERIASILPLPQPIRFTLGDGGDLEIREAVTLQLGIGGQPVIDSFMVLPGGAAEEVILGASTMRKYGLKIDLEHSTVFSEMKEQPPTQKEKSMEEVLKRIFARMNKEVSPDLTDDDAISMIVELCQPKMYPIASTQVLSLLGLNEAATEPQVQGKILALTHRADVVPAADYNALKLQLHERDKKDALTAAVAAGKITPAERASWEAKLASNEISLETFAAFVAERPKVVPVGVTLPKEEPKAAAAMKLDDLQATINKQLGLDDATFGKYAQ